VKAVPGLYSFRVIVFSPLILRLMDYCSMAGWQPYSGGSSRLMADSVALRIPLLERAIDHDEAAEKSEPRRHRDQTQAPPSFVVVGHED